MIRELWEVEPPAYFCEECGHGGDDVDCCDCRCCHPRPVTVLELAEHRLGRPARTGADFEKAGFAIFGGCKTCGASIAAYNAYPAHDGYWRCASCIGGGGWDTVEAADFDIFSPSRWRDGDDPTATHDSSS